jgi:hypothetical protein
VTTAEQSQDVSKAVEKARIARTMKALLRLKNSGQRLTWQIRLVQRYRLACGHEFETPELKGVVIGAQMRCPYHGLQPMVDFGRFPPGIGF